MSEAYPHIKTLRDADIGFGIIPFRKGPLFRIMSPWNFTVDINGFRQEYVIPVGYEFDKASIPAILWGPPLNYTPDGLCTIPALVHDFLCDLYNGGSEWLKQKLGGSLPPCPPAELIHLNFYRMLQAEGVRPRKASIMYSAVRNFGPGGRLKPSTWFK